MSFYEDISGEFQKVSQFFKYGNLRLFQKDMAHYLTDLQFTKGKDAYVYTLKMLTNFHKICPYCRKHLQSIYVGVEVSVRTTVPCSPMAYFH